MTLSLLEFDGGMVNESWLEGEWVWLSSGSTWKEVRLRGGVTSGAPPVKFKWLPGPLGGGGLFAVQRLLLSLFWIAEATLFWDTRAPASFFPAEDQPFKFWRRMTFSLRLGCWKVSSERVGLASGSSSSPNSLTFSLSDNHSIISCLSLARMAFRTVDSSVEMLGSSQDRMI